MRFGVTMFPTDKSIGIVELARASEERGFASLYVPEHTHIPASRATPAPAGEPLGEEYYRSLDPFVALTAAAVAAPSLTIGTGIALVAQRDPIVTAKEVASLDHVSGGRFVFGIGFGWNVEELADHGVRFADRRAVVRERVEAMKAIWTQEQASYSGTFVDLPPTFSWPKPVQQPHPPILIGGGGGPKLFEAIAQYADGWIPIGGAGVNKQLPALHEAMAKEGRDPAQLRIVPFGVLPDPGKLAYYEESGFEEVVFRVPPAPEAKVLEVLDRLAADFL
ncbi:MAG TPA: TIGR03619 family F420-dependent LLM class oxidoreductase [Acidimicrobiales bacterium]|nr:TIGR03619 family F420-dependent LLM class oxidoreductase [Acidimicrobiales bacterium]